MKPLHMTHFTAELDDDGVGDDEDDSDDGDGSVDSNYGDEW